MTIHAIYRRISPRFRRRRMQRFWSVANPPSNATILDVGGTREYWTAIECPDSATITLLNQTAAALGANETNENRIQTVVGDACALPFPSKSFDVVFSNSVIEHVGTWGRQLAFAQEARRVGRALWIQTPAREFFIEPHLVAPFVHWLPPSAQRKVIRNFTLRGWIERPTRSQIEAFLQEVRLLTFSEMQELFPDCTILRERFCGLTKSYIALRPAS